MAGLIRKLAVICVAALFVAFCVFCVLWTPYRPQDLYRAIPSDAVLVTEHRALAERFAQLSESVFCAELLELLPPEAQNRFERDKRALFRLMRLTRHETLVAYAPDIAGSGAPAWLAAVWIGNWSTLLRWMFFFKPPAQCAEIGSYGGRLIWSLQKPFWRVADAGAARTWRVSFVIGDGILLVALSPHPSAACYMMMACDGQIPSAAKWMAAQSVPDHSALDRGWFRMRPDGSGCSGVFSVARLDAHGVAGLMRLSGHNIRHPLLAGTLPQLAGGGALFELPALLLALPLETVRDLTANAAQAWAPATAIFGSGLIDQASNSLLAALFTGEYGGRFGRDFFRVKVPALTVFCRARSQETLQSVMALQLDNLNARYRLGLIVDPLPLKLGAQEIWTLETTNNSFLAGLRAEDRPAYAQVGGDLAVASHAGSLIGLLQRLPGSGSVVSDGVAHHWRAITEQPGLAGVFLADLEQGADAVGLILSFWGLWQRDAARPDVPESIRFARVVLNHLRALRFCAVEMFADGDEAVIKLRVGPDAARL